MPMDLLNQRNLAAKGVNQFLREQEGTITNLVGQTRRNILGGRAPLTDALGKAGGSFHSGAVRASSIAQAPALNRAMDDRLARTNFDQQRTRMNLLYNHAVQMAVDAGYDLNRATDFARQFVADQQRRQFEADQNTTERGHRAAMTDIGAQYANKGLAMEQAYQPQNDFGSALTRVLAGTGAAVGTAYAMNRMSKPATPQLPGTTTNSRFRAGTNDLFGTV